MLGTMNTQNYRSGLQLRSLVKKSGEMELSLAATAVPNPGADEVIVRIDAAPINPSDLGLLLANADWTSAKVSGPADPQRNCRDQRQRRASHGRSGGYFHARRQ
jgi:hypothetical protein